MKSMPDDCSTTLSSVLHQNGSHHDKCAGSGVIIIFSKTERKEIPEHFCFVFVIVFASAKICE